MLVDFLAGSANEHPSLFFLSDPRSLAHEKNVPSPIGRKALMNGWTK